MITSQSEAPGIAKELGIPKLFFKREDLHPYGSHKGRSIPLMIDMKAAEGEKHFAISSSGNAALAAIRYIQEKDSTDNVNDPLALSVFIGEHIDSKKGDLLLSEVKNPHITIEKTPRPLQSLFKFVTGNKASSLRQSTESSALVGYKILAEEIAPTPNLSAIFIPTSSGTTAEALGRYFSDPSTAKPRPVAIHIVQTTGIFPIAEAFEDREFVETPSIADAIVDKVAHRKDAVIEMIRKTRGSGWIATNDEIIEAQKLLKEKAHIEATPNGALGLAGLIHALRKGASFDGAVVCIITGR
jgi:threonine synthase